MIDSPAAEPWIVDFASHLASRGDVIVRFNETGGEGLEIVFVAGAESSLEERCLIAGDAMMAIRSKQR